ncbi:MAG: hypothetical protein AAF990_17030 [Bacteroidota bacterium]
MTAVSSSLTLILKLVLPTLWITFFSGFTAAIFALDVTYIGPIPIFTFRIGLLIFLILGILFLYWSVMRLKRVDMDQKFIYATNYFKTYRYPFHQVARIEERDYKLFNAIDIYFKQEGSFGKKITFLAHRYRYKDFVQKYPGAFQGLLEQRP